MTSQNYNRATAVVATGAFLILSILVANLSTPKSGDPIAQRPSSFFTDPTGARALLLVMRRLLPAAEQWRRPFNRLARAGIDGASSLIVADPKLPLGKNEIESLQRWLADGGQLILLSHNGWPLRNRLAPENEVAEQSERLDNDGGAEPEEATGTLLSRYAPALRWAKPGNFRVEPASGSSIPETDVKLRWRRSFAAVDGVKSIASAGNQTLAVEIAVGQGRIVAVADPTMTSNGSLRRSDNAVWLVGLVAGWGDGRVFFDEYHHGFGDKRSAASLAWAFSQTPWGWCLWQLAAAGLLYIFAYRRRFGRISEPPTFERSNPLDLVDARAGIFRAARAQRLATRLMLQNLSQVLSQAHGRSIDVTRLSARAGNRMATQISPESLAELQTLAAKTERGETLSEREFIEIGRLTGALSTGRKP
ncbi:MAG: DUF4350 domain-containing protein [Candidatus Binatia bacterium]